MNKPKRIALIFRAAVFAGAITVGLAGVLQTAALGDFESLRGEAGKLLSNFYGFWALFLLVTLLIVALVQLLFYYNAQGRSERIFSQDGILLFDREQHIAISVPTMKAILLSLAGEVDAKRAAQLLYHSGQIAGRRFGEAFRTIYIEQIQPHGEKPWSSLGDNEKLDAWERYDSTAGWGNLRARKYREKAIVTVEFRHPTLYEGAGGHLFSWLLAGYSQEVVAALLGRQVSFEANSGFGREEGFLWLSFSY